MLKAYKLRFTSPLHLGSGRTDYDRAAEYLHSDTIKSALFSVALQAGLTDESNEFFNSFTVSSAFPYYKDLLFFPKPMLKLPLKISDAGGESKEAKKLKKLEFIAKPLFEKIINGAVAINLTSRHFVSNGQYLVDDVEMQLPTLMNREIQQRVRIPQNRSEDTLPYYVERIRFQRDSGLYFIAQASDAKKFELISKCLNILGNQGFGTDKSVGNGQFEHTVADFELEQPASAEYLISLSLYCPAKDEVSKDLLDDASYLLIKRGGYISSSSISKYTHFRKKSVYMFAPGSVFPGSIPLKGKIVDLKPDKVNDLHSVWRDGTSLFISAK